jgi:preprotein translocase subunit SecA
MLKNLLNKVFGDRHEREARKLTPLVADINEVAERLRGLSDDELKAQTPKFRAVIQERTADLEAEIAELRQEAAYDGGRRRSGRR